MMLAIPHFGGAKKEKMIELIRVEDIRKIVVRIGKEEATLILVKDEPIGKIHVKESAVIDAIDNLHFLMRRAEQNSRSDAIVVITKEGEIRPLRDMLKGVLKDGDHS